jgi:hypothetical protein
MFIMFTVSLSALALQSWNNFQQGHHVLAGLAFLLFALAGVLVREAALAMRNVGAGEAALEKEPLLRP